MFRTPCAIRYGYWFRQVGEALVCRRRDSKIKLMSRSLAVHETCPVWKPEPRGPMSRFENFPSSETRLLPILGFIWSTLKQPRWPKYEYPVSVLEIKTWIAQIDGGSVPLSEPQKGHMKSCHWFSINELGNEGMLRAWTIRHNQQKVKMSRSMCSHQAPPSENWFSKNCEGVNDGQLSYTQTLHTILVGDAGTKILIGRLNVSRPGRCKRIYNSYYALWH